MTDETETETQRHRSTNEMLLEFEALLWKFENASAADKSLLNDLDLNTGDSSRDMMSDNLSSTESVDLERKSDTSLSDSKELDPKILTRMINEIFDCILVEQGPKGINENTLARLFKLLGVLILRVPKATYLTKLFRLCYLSPEMTFFVARCLRSILEDTCFEPGEALVFPQFELRPECVDSEIRQLKKFEERTAGTFVIEKIMKIQMSLGLTISTWIKLTASKFDVKQHVISIGCKALKAMIEICPNSYVLRASIITNGGVILKKSFANILKVNGQWVNVMLGIQYNHGELRSVIMAGNQNYEISRRYKIHLRKDDSEVQVALGSYIPITKQQIYIYRMSTIFGFKGLMSTSYGVILRSLGSACFSLTECRLSQTYSSLLHCLGKPIIASKHCDAAEICDDASSFLNRLRRNLLFTWRPCSAHCCSFNIFQKGVDFSMFSDYNDTTMCLAMSQDFPVYWQSMIEQESGDTIDKSIRTIGSVKIFLFLYALSVEMGASTADQAETFHLLFVCLKRDPSYFEIFNDLGGPLILVRILSARQSHFTLAMCQDILMYAFSKLESRNCELYASPRTAIVEPRILKALICAAEIWRGNRFEYWCRIVSVVSESVSLSMPETFRNFNRSRLTNMQFLHHILLTLLEMNMYHGHGHYETALSSDKNLLTAQRRLSRASSIADVSTPISVMLKNLVIELVGTPFGTNEVMQLWGFILLSHPPHDTYFDYSTRCHNEWMSEELLGITEEPDVTGPFELSEFFSDLLKEYGTSGIKKLWHDCEQNVIKFRNLIFKNQPTTNVSSPASTTIDSPRRKSSQFRFCRMNSLSSFSKRKQSQSKNQHNKSSDNISECTSVNTENWLIETRAELLEFMSNIVLQCDDDLMSIMEKDFFYWPTILVLLSNQKNSRICISTFTLLKNYFLRCSSKNRQTFVTKQGFLLMSNEIKKLKVNNVIADALFSLTCGEHITIHDGLDTLHLEDISYDSFKMASFYALYSLLEESVYDSALFWNVCSALQKIFITNNAPRRAMFDAGLIATMTNVLWKLCFSENSPPVDSPMFSPIDCWISFAQSILAYTIPHKDEENYTACEDFIWLCLIAGFQSDVFANGDPQDQINVSRLEGTFQMNINSALKRTNKQQFVVGVRAMRKALCQIIYCWIDTIQTLLTDQFYPFTKRGKNNCSALSSSMDDSDFELVLEDEKEHSWVAQDTGRPKAKEFASSEEMASRLIFGLRIAQNFFFFFTPPNNCSDQEETLFHYYIDIVLLTWKRKQNEKLNDEWQAVLAICREKARVLLAELIAFVFYPAGVKLTEFLKRKAQEETYENDQQSDGNDTHPTTSSKDYSMNNADGTVDKFVPWPLERRLIIVRFLSHESVHNRYYMETLLDVNLDYQYAMKIALHELALLPQIVCKYNLDEYNLEIEGLVKFLGRIQIESPLGKLTREEVNSIRSDEILLIHSYFKAKKEFCNQISAKAFLICETENALNKITTDTAMTLTCEIAEYQNNPRRVFIFWRKDLMNILAKAGNTIENMIRELTHPQAAFFDVSSWPISRVLETTENPFRERRRLTPMHYQFPLKFLQRPQRVLAEALNSTYPPLHNILHSFKDHKSLDHTEAITQIRLSVSATLLRIAFECSGEIIIADGKLYFLGEHAKSTQKGINYAPVTYSFAFDKIREIQTRSYLLKDTALEIFTTYGDAFLIIFSTPENRNTLTNQLRQMDLNHLFVDHKSQLNAAVDKWRKGSITNFEYLMILNKLAGRSFNDLMQYPVFPFVLSNYSQATLDLHSSISYRDLTKPMAIQDPKMEQVYIQNYNNLLEEYNKSSKNIHSSVKFGAYHYGSHYSNTGIVAYYLVRVSPYTSVALEYQDNNFDIADRLFNSIETTWRLSSSESTTDFKELIPEFFFLPEMFQNLQRLDLGVRQAGQPVENVQLPPWCPRANGGDSPDGDARLFCLIHRQALESATVTSNLHNWIDLIFGNKQNGEASVAAVNMFHPATYRGRDLESENLDELTKLAVRTMVRTYGQMPLVLFPSPHLPYFTNSLRRRSFPGNLASSSALFNFATEEDTIVNYSNRVFRTVSGLRWGEFYGTPEVHARHYQSPTFTFKVDRNERVDNLSLVYERDGIQSCCGVPSSTKLVTYYKWDRRDPLRRTLEPLLSAAVSWRFVDNVVRIKALNKDDNYWINLVDMQSLELAKVAFSSNNEFLFLGFKCGLIRVYSLNYKSDVVSFHRKWTIKLCSELLAHEFPITSISVSDEFHILVSTSTDRKICLWDTNRMEFIGELNVPPHPNGVDETVTFSCISSTSADVCVCLQSGHTSRLVLFTVNGELVGTHIEKQTVTCLTMTNMPEGLGINCIAVGLSSGVIRLLDMWTMGVVQEFSYSGYTSPITSLLFTYESRRLYAVVGGLDVLCLQLPTTSNNSSFKTPSFKAFNPFS